MTQPANRRFPMPDATLTALRKAAAEGLDLPECAKRAHISYPTAYSACKKHGIKFKLLRGKGHKPTQPEITAPTSSHYTGIKAGLSRW